MSVSEDIMKHFFRNYQKAANDGDADSMIHVSLCYALGYGVQKNEDEAFVWCTKAAETKSLNALFYLAENYEIREIPVLPEKAFTWYHYAAKAGHLGAIWKVVCCYFCGYGTEKNPLECAYWKD